MEIYIEYALAENWILDTTLLYLALKTVRLPVVKIRIFLSAACGALFATFFPLLRLTGFFSFAVRYAFGAILCLVAVRSHSMKNYLLVVLFFYLYTFALGGALLGVYNFFRLEYTASGRYIVSQTPVAVVLIGACGFFLLMVKLISALYHKYGRKKLLYLCEINLNGVKISGTGLLDTGNSLLLDGVPVCLLDKDDAAVFLEELNRENLEKSPRKLSDESPIKKIKIKTATGEGELIAFFANLKIYSEDEKNIIDKVYFAVAPVALGNGYQIILHPQLFKEGSRAEKNSATSEKTMEKNISR